LIFSWPMQARPASSHCWATESAVTLSARQAIMLMSTPRRASGQWARVVTRRASLVMRR
jgi:hypothetical protein